MLEMQALTLRYGAQTVLEHVDLRLAPGERLGLLGPSGAGKSSLLRLAAGLLRPSAGTLRNTFRHPVLVFQEPRLLPWRHALDNVALPLRAAGHRADDARAIASGWLARVGLDAAGQAWPGELSGGMAQRVSLARALALEPDLLLLDEPFSALDPGLRHQLSTRCDEELTRRGAALLCISHDPQELLGLVDRCVVVDQGRVTPVPLSGPIGSPQRAADAVRLRTLLLATRKQP
ncbi:ATP-binding cassette domain-containing protein [Achromobacter deleyi]|uniref:ATP-binding cassette domain-containing protein n=1 Tax=Achromobacter deleyi TaxID=1353891 RepID=UPI0014909B4C|nr:ATP-binding cassette domain-containing protein [Achromobacter deleyi]QVQ26075.1 ABC transporter ATP-binding protein [Achromobacter deleyi]UIP21634.1 ATP-binding cassette domain-containing protein [Achromobacter deleyi]